MEEGRVLFLVVVQELFELVQMFWVVAEPELWALVARAVEFVWQVVMEVAKSGLGDERQGGESVERSVVVSVEEWAEDWDAVFVLLVALPVAG